MLTNTAHMYKLQSIMSSGCKCLIHQYTVSQKMSHLWIAITLRHANGFWYFFGRNVTDRVSNQKTLVCHLKWLVLLHYLVKWRNTKIACSLKCCISALPEFNQLFDFFNLLDSRLILTTLYDSLSHIINAFSPQDWRRHGSGEGKSRALQELDCVAHTVHQCAVFRVSYFAR